MRSHGFRRFIVVVILLLSMVSPAFAAAAGRPRPAAACSATGAVVLADGWGIGHFLAGGGRSRVVQISVVAMAIGLFIMMRKFNG